MVSEWQVNDMAVYSPKQFSDGLDLRPCSLGPNNIDTELLWFYTALAAAAHDPLAYSIEMSDGRSLHCESEVDEKRSLLSFRMAFIWRTEMSQIGMIVLNHIPLLIYRQKL